MIVILHCAAPCSEQECEERIRALLAGFGEVIRMVIAHRADPAHGWTVLAELSAEDGAAVVAGLRAASVEGFELRARLAPPVFLPGLARRPHGRHQHPAARHPARDPSGH